MQLVEPLMHVLQKHKSRNNFLRDSMLCSSGLTNWHSLLGVLIVFGAMGGVGRSLIEYVDQDLKFNRNKVLIGGLIGSIAGLVVPLFLNASSSSIISSVLNDGENSGRDWFFLIGYAVLSGLVGSLFLKSMASKMLDDLKRDAQKSIQIANDAKETSTQASQIANAAKNDTDALALEVDEKIQKATNETRNLIRPLALIDEEKYSDAIRELEEAIQEDPKSAEAYAWLSYCLKHNTPSDVEAALGAIQTAIKMDANPRPSHNWLYNAGCYMALLDYPEDEVISMLRRSLECANESQRKAFIVDLTDDSDLSKLQARNHGSAFQKFVREVKRST